MKYILRLRQAGVFNAVGATALGCAALIAAGWFITLERIHYERGNAVEDAVRQNANLALAFEEQTLHAIKRADQTLLYLKRGYEREGRIADLRELAAEGGIDDTMVPNRLVTDASGNVLEANGKAGPVNIADRDFFESHRRGPPAGLQISAPFTGRVTGYPVISISRPLIGADGSFLGIVAVGLDPNYFLESYKKFALPQGSQIQLVRLDGTALARRFGDRTSFGDDMRESTLLKHAAAGTAGNFVSRGRADGVQRFMSYRVLKDYGLVVSVGTSVDQALAQFHSRERSYYLGASALTLGTLLFGAGLAFSLRRRKQAMDAASLATRRYQATFDQAAVGVAHATCEGKLLKVNRKLCEMLGYTEAELLARAWTDVTHPDDVKRSIELVRKMVSVPGATVPEVEKRYRRKDGSELWGIANLALVRDADGRPDYVVTVLQDITERKSAEAAARESERRFSDMLRNLELIAMTLDREARISYCNDYLLRLTGWRREDVLGRNWFELFIPADDREVHETFAALIEDRPEAAHHENEILTRSGERRMIRWNNSVLRSTAGEVIGAASIGEDITARKQAEARLLEQLDELRRFQKVTVDRELRMLELEREIGKLKEKAPA